MSEENDDKPFEASDQKLRKAREKGDIPRSAELNVASRVAMDGTQGPIAVLFLSPAVHLGEMGEGGR